MLTRLLLLCVLVYMVTGQAKHGKDVPGTCQDPVAPAGVTTKSKPTIPQQFSAKIECVIVNKNLSIDIHEYFDNTNNRGFLTQIQNGEEFAAWYDYSINEFISYFPSINQCMATKLSTSNQRFLFGYTAKGKSGHIFSAGQALHFKTDAKEVYMGTTMFRGIAVDVWQSCQYWDIFDATMTVSWYFSASTEWDTAIGQPVPVGAHIVGKAWDTPTSTGRPFEHYYDIFHFRTDTPPAGIFQPPQGVLCTNRLTTMALPSLPSAFSFTVEVVDKVLGSVSYMTEYYDSLNKFVRYIYRPLPSDNSPFGTNDLVQIHDFNTGVAYVTDQTSGNCTVTPIHLTFDGEKNTAGTLRLRSSREFFYYDYMNYTYEGVNKIRYIDVDTWIGQRPNYPPGQGGVSTWQLYFATKKWYSISTANVQSGTPIQLTIKSPTGDMNICLPKASLSPEGEAREKYDRLRAGMNFEYHMFNFKNSVPDLLNYDVSACYINRNRRKFQMKFPGQYTNVVASNMDLFKYYILTSLTKTLQVSALRVSNIRVFLDKDIVVTFQLLDVAPILGDVTNHPIETPLATAANTLINAVKKEQFVIAMHFNNFNQLTGMIPMPKSLIETTYLWNSQTNQPIPQSGSTGYGAGVMAAVGVVIPVASAALGGVFAFFFFK